MSELVLLDTDIGSDVDDAVCLAYLLAQPQCKLVGITTVTADVIARASMADALCKAAGQDIPIYPGLRRPQLIELRQTQVQQAGVLARWSHRKEFPQHEAIEFMRRTIRQHPGQITLLGIGPLTNIAMLFAADPEIPQLLKQLVIMGGNYTPVRWGSLSGGLVEWNIWNDPHAAAAVFATQTPRMRLIGLDTTRQVELNVDTAKERFQGGLLDFVADCAKVWFDGGRSKVTFHDPLAAVSIFDADVCTYQKGSVAVELVSKLLEGFTLFKPDPAGALEVATSVASGRFFDDYFSVF